MAKTIESNSDIIDLQAACNALTTAKVTSTALYVTLPVSEPIKEQSQHDLETMAGAVLQRIAEGKKPSATFIKELQKIKIHTDHLTKAYVALLGAYQSMISTPLTLEEKLNSAADAAKIKTARAMLVTFDNKQLRSFASMQGVLADDYVLPDERGKLIDLVVDIMIEKGAL